MDTIGFSNGWEFYLSISIFIITYIGILTEKVPRSVCSLIGGGLMIYFGLETQESALKEYIDFNTIGLLTGMMILVEVVKRSGCFELLALWAVKKSKGKAVRLMVLLSGITGFGAALIDSITAALLIAPITLSICRMLKITPIPILISEILISNIGGTAFMIGNPPNVMIGSAAHLEFTDFILNLTPVVLITAFVTLFVLSVIYQKELHTETVNDVQLEDLCPSSAIKDKRLFARSLLILGVTIGGFIIHTSLGLQSATIAMTGGVLALLICRISPEDVFREIDFNTLFFFMGLFAIVGGLEASGVMTALASWGIAQVQGDTQIMTFLILWLSGIISAFVDNIPFTATMIPLIQNIQNLLGMSQTNYMWWSLSLGACFGGNGTIIGASPNIIILAIAAKEGFEISFKEFAKICFPIMLLTLTICSAYLYLRYLY